MKVSTLLTWLIVFFINLLLVFAIPPYSGFDELHHTFLLFNSYPDLHSDNVAYTIIQSVMKTFVKDFNLLEAHINPFVWMNPPLLSEPNPYYLVFESNNLVYFVRLAQVMSAWTVLICATFLISRFVTKLPSYLISFVLPAWLLVPIAWQNIVSIGPQFLLIPLAPLIGYLIFTGMKGAAIACLVTVFFWESDGQSKLFLFYAVGFSFLYYRQKLFCILKSLLIKAQELFSGINFSNQWVLIAGIMSLPVFVFFGNKVLVIILEFVHISWAHQFYPNFVYLQAPLVKSAAVSLLSIVGFGFSSGKLLPIPFYLFFVVLFLGGIGLVVFEKKFWKIIFPCLIIFALLVAFFPGLSNMRYHYFVVSLILLVGSGITYDKLVSRNVRPEGLGMSVLCGLASYDFAMLFYFQHAIS